MMKSIFVTTALACGPVLAAKSTPAPPTTEAAATPAPVVTAPMLAQPANPVAATTPPSTFCGQAGVYQLLMNTEVGRQLQLQFQEELRKAIARAVADGKIPVADLPPVPAQPAAVFPQLPVEKAQPAPATPASPEMPAPSAAAASEATPAK